MLARMTLDARLDAGVATTFEEVLEEVRNSRPIAPPPGSYARVDGRYYLHSGIGLLPRSRAFFEAVKMCGGHAAVVVIGYFIERGFTCWDRDLESVIERLASANPETPRAASVNQERRDD